MSSGFFLDFGGTETETGRGFRRGSTSSPDLLHFQSLKIGDRVKEGDRLFVVEGNLTAAEFYSPVDGYIDSVTGNPKISDWLVVLKP
ncbi:hypothetical protein [Yoonia sp.]|uniref:hypothetical protein n=1 Tax=Yoonia sp. TaxID=2212373 RepID=UPI002DFD822D|nr:hypothetical protein [Yoonia sp.]